MAEKTAAGVSEIQELTATASLYTLCYVEVLEGAQGVNGIVIKYDLC